MIFVITDMLVVGANLTVNFVPYIVLGLTGSHSDNTPDHIFMSFAKKFFSLVMRTLNGSP